MADHARLDRFREDNAIDGERAPAGDARLVRGLEHDAAEQPHFSLEQAVRVHRFDRFEGVAADQLGQGLGLMRRGHPDWAHLVQRHADATLGQRPRGLTTRQATTNDKYGRSMLRPCRGCPYVVTSSASGADSSTLI